MARKHIRQRVDNPFNSDYIDVVLSPAKKVVSIKLDVDIIEELDKLWRKLGYNSRSEFIREAILFYMQYMQEKHKTKRAGNTDKMVQQRLPLKELEEVIDDIIL
ncbi:MAG TPA: ribbon-helix-helix protein, CopG family [Pyrodictium sp.]|nr:ribbon-helix-helix protein, CopG family [Pyrodictium sp.]HIQ10897.1 ribbon-helix-helix protein, CopG family [Pyrodictium sp.]